MASRTRPLGLTLPEELVEMYEWRNGQGEDAEMSLDSLNFRDNKFVDLDGGLPQHGLIWEHYAPEPETIPWASTSVSRSRSRP